MPASIQLGFSACAKTGHIELASPPVAAITIDAAGGLRTAFIL
jgi:hypothetical protein